jgi:precorrin-6Y C5,15-methyltransferase (decarboxylating)
MNKAKNTQARCTIVGILDDGWSGLAGPAQAALAGAALVIGAQRTLDLVAPQLAAGCTCRALDGQLSAVPAWIATALAAGQPVVVLATGDPLCHGIASYLLGKLGGERCLVLPAPSTLQLAFARLKRPWQAARIVSIHAEDAGEWAPGSTPAHGLYALLRAAGEAPLLAVLTSPANSPERIARALLAAGYGDEEFRLSVVARLCLADEQVWADLDLAQAAALTFPEPNVVVLERRTAAPALPRFGFEDSDFIQRTPEKGLITKLEARAVSLAKLRLRADAVVWDIGAGSGSVGLEAARLANRGHVWAIEKNEGDAANARANAERFRAHNYTLAHGKAPAGLDAWPDPDAVFIGGSGGELAELIALILARLKPGGRLVMNFVTLENLATATAALAALGASWEVTQLQASRSQPILDMHRLAAQNPVWIVCADALGEKL